MSNNIVKVGLAVFVFKDGQFVMLQRKGAHGAGSWSIPGGHIEFGESFEQTAAREVLEETGMSITNIRFAAVTNDLFEAEGKHYITIWMASDWQAGEATITEPDRCSQITWCNFATMPQPLFLPFASLEQSEFIDKLREMD